MKFLISQKATLGLAPRVICDGHYWMSDERLKFAEWKVALDEAGQSVAEKREYEKA